MAIHRWVGQTVAVAQVATGSIDSLDATPANNTFTVTIGGVAISVAGVTDVATTATALRAALNASTHPYFSGITWSGSSGNIIGTADTAGVPFTAALTETGAGTGAVTDFAATTANAGPNVLAAANIDSGALPSNGDTLIFENSAVDVLWALDAMTASTTLTIIIRPTYTGKIGLNKRAFQTSSTASNSSYPEYREDELTVDGATLVWLPRHNGNTSPSKSTRILINTKTSAAAFLIEDTATTATESDLEPVRIKGSHASNTMSIRGTSIVGLATNDPADAAQYTTVEIGDSARVNSSAGTTIATLTLRGSPNVRVGLAPTTIHGGEEGITANLLTTFAGTVTTAVIGEGMTITHSGGSSTITTLNHYGTLDLSQAIGTFTVTTYNVLSNKARFRDPFKRVATNTDFVFGSGIVPASFFEMGGGRTLRMTA